MRFRGVIISFTDSPTCVPGIIEQILGYGGEVREFEILILFNTEISDLLTLLRRNLDFLQPM